ncbi:MAG: molybdenum cofactor biosynthesis protein MoaB [Anaerolineae bacterium]|nr:molybdenum cofactor biosynthesis protein MoaB [Anaerolineae bacterium]
MSEPVGSSQEHKQFAAERGPIAVAIVTCSDSRTLETDTNYHYLRREIEAAGHRVVAYRIIKDEPDLVAATLDAFASGEAQVIIFNGGTGISQRDTTYDVLARKLDKTIPGFGELFRMLSWDQIGPAAMMSRATAGVYRGTVVFSTPGSHKAVQLAWQKLIAPELQHVAWEVWR